MIIHSDYPFPVKKTFLNNDIEIAYMDIGKGDQTLVFIHGFASYSPVWAKNIAVLSKYFRCLALDLPGHGLSSVGDYSYSISFYADIIKSWLSSLHLPKVILIGHSMGGQIAIHLAIKDPVLMSHLVLVAPAGFETFHQTQIMLMNQLTAAGIIGSSQYFKLVLNLKNYFYSLNEKEYEKLNEFNRDFYSLNDNPNLIKVLNRSIKGMTKEPVFQDLDKLSMPVLVYFGKNDNLIPNRLLNNHQTPVEIAEKACKIIPDCQLKIYDKCGHFLQYEYPSRFNIDLYKFLHPQIFSA